MARPFLLIKAKLLTKLQNEHSEGVPVTKLIRKHELQGKITAPTLTKLIRFADTMDKIQANPSASNDTYQTIYNSIFPQWLHEAENDIVLQPAGWRYTGRMPLGKWEERCWTND
jgi:hypothetical protein